MESLLLCYMKQGIRLRFGIRGLLWATLIVAIICGVISFASRMYYAERYAVQAILKKVDGIGYSINTFEDVTEEVANVTITVDSVPDSKIVLVGLSEYESNGCFAITQIGKWRFVTTGSRFLGAVDSVTGKPEKSNYWGGHLAINPNSPYKEIIPFPINTVQDIVDHYEELVEFFDSWPRESNPGRVILEDGSVQKYYVLDTGGK